jgi:hypothetical protein
MNDADKEAVFRAYDGGDGSISYQEFIRDVCKEGGGGTSRRSSRASLHEMSAVSGRSSRSLSNSTSLPSIGKSASPAPDNGQSHRSKEEERRKILREMKKLELEIAVKRNNVSKMKMQRELEEEQKNIPNAT